MKLAVWPQVSMYRFTAGGSLTAHNLLGIEVDALQEQKTELGSTSVSREAPVATRSSKHHFIPLLFLTLRKYRVGQVDHQLPGADDDRCAVR